jgi:RNase adapter protein RapZ
VTEYVEAGELAQEFYDRLFPLLDFVLPAYVNEGKTHLTIAIGCTGGRHRSLTVADRIASHLTDHEDVSLRIVHRDVELD